MIICRVNKIFKDLEAAEKRVKEWLAPQNAKRLNRKTPCVDCGFDPRSFSFDRQVPHKPRPVGGSSLLSSHYAFWALLRTIRASTATAPFSSAFTGLISTPSISGKSIIN
jgi:hypothetical protein